MKTLNKSITNAVERPVKVLQFGEGNFLRAFVDYMIDAANEQGVFNGNIVIVKPIAYGNLETFHKQDCQYTVSLRGKEDGETKVVNRIITSVSDAIDSITEYEKYSAYAKSEDLRFIVSNTTEAGIVFDDTDSFKENPPRTFPGKLTKFLYERYRYFNGDSTRGLILIPCELIENNGGTLKQCVLKYAGLWKLEGGFLNWVNDSCIFCSTLVDRIVTGYPKEEVPDIYQELGYEDALLVTGELFGLWVIESEKDISIELPLHKAGLPVLFTDNQRPYRDRKVRILNGAHTSFVLASYLAGNDYVKESMEDKDVREFITKTIFDEILPTLSLPREELIMFADSVLERFENPYIKHSLLSISLNSVSKWKARCLPSFCDYVERYGKIPLHLTFSLAALICFYRSDVQSEKALIGYRDGESYKIMDDDFVLDFFKQHAKLPTRKLVEAYLASKALFGGDIVKYKSLTDMVTLYIETIETYGMREALQRVTR